MEVYTIGTGSSGNSYVVGINDSYVLLDCGLRFREITHHPKFPSFSKLDFVFCSHEHGDHNKSLKDFKRSGCKIVSYETLPNNPSKLDSGTWEILTFQVAHNVKCFGVLLKHKETGEKLCYMTDFYKAPMIENCNEFIFEVNYIDALIDEMIDEDKEFRHLGFNNHCSLEYATEYFSSMKTKPKKIYCCHGSKSHSIKKRIYEGMKQFADEVIVL